MPRTKSLAAVSVLVASVVAIPMTALAGGYEYYSAAEDPPLWLPPAPYPYMDAPPMVYAPNYYLNGPGAQVHIEWCVARYRSYNPATNMYLGYDGNYYRCRGPAI